MPTLQRKWGNMYLLLSASAEGKHVSRPAPPREETFTVPRRHGKKYSSSRPAEGKDNHPPVLPRENILQTRPVVKICPVEFHHSVPSRNCPSAVPSHPAAETAYDIFLPFGPVPYSISFWCQSRKVGPVPILSHCAKPFIFCYVGQLLPSIF